MGKEEKEERDKGLKGKKRKTGDGKGEGQNKVVNFGTMTRITVFTVSGFCWDTKFVKHR